MFKIKNYPLAIVAGFLGLFAVAAVVVGLVKIGGLFLVVLAPTAGYLAYILWKKVV